MLNILCWHYACRTSDNELVKPSLGQELVSVKSKDHAGKVL